MAMSTNSQDSMLSEINVTPLVDVMLVLLVIFMVTAPLVQQQVDVTLPQTQAKQKISVKENDVVLVINKNRELSISKTKLSLAELEPKLKAIFENKKTKELYLQADQGIPYGFVVEVMALVKNAGIDKMGMITDPKNKAKS